MRRTLLAALGGAALGAGATYALMTDRDSPAAAGTAALVPLPALSPAASLASDLPTAERLALYEETVGATVPELRALLAESASQASTPAGRFRLETALARYAELDARGAAALTDELGLDAALAAQAYAAWTIAEPVAALRALGEIRDEARARAIADTVARVLARRDPEEAFASARRIGRSDLEMLFESVAMQTWAASAPDEMVEYFAALPDARLEALLSAPSRDLRGFGSAQVQPRVDLIHALAQAAPQRLLEIAQRLSAPLAAEARRIGIASLMEQDPLAAIAYVEDGAANAEQQRQELALIAPVYARRDPAGALAWARANGHPDLLAQVLSGIAAADPLLAVDTALAETVPMERTRLLQTVVASFWSTDGAALEAVADRLLIEPSVDTSIVAALVNRWSAVDPTATIEWLLTHGERAGADAFRQAALQASRHDVRAAAAYTSRVPDAMRPAWLSQVASAYAVQDPVEAARWIEQFRGQPGYDDAVIAAARSAAARDPAAAADVLARADPSSPQHMSAAASIAAAWTRLDPAAAAAWASGLDGPARQVALPSIVSMWAQQAPHEARSFVLSMPRGEARDSSLQMLVAAASQTDEGLDPGLLAAFSSDFARQSAVTQAALVRAAQDPTAARALIDAHVTDPGLKARAEAMLSRRPTFPPEVVGLSSGDVLLGNGSFVQGFAAPMPRFFPPPGVEGARVVTSAPVVIGAPSLGVATGNAVRREPPAGAAPEADR